MGVVTHARHATNKDQSLCPAVGRTLKLSTARAEIDCKRCLKLLQNSTISYVGVDPASGEDRTAVVVVSKSPGSETIVVEAYALTLQAYAAKAKRVRVVRCLTWNAGSDFDSPLDVPMAMQREVVRFNGSEAAFRIWMQTNHFDPKMDTAEHVYVTTRDPEHTARWFSKGFTPIDTRSRRAYVGPRMRFIDPADIPLGGSLLARDYVSGPRGATHLPRTDH